MTPRLACEVQSFTKVSVPYLQNSYPFYVNGEKSNSNHILLGPALVRRLLPPLGSYSDNICTCSTIAS